MNTLKNAFRLLNPSTRFKVLAISIIALVLLGGLRLTRTWAAGTISLTALGVAYTQDFNMLAITGTSSATPVGWDFSESGTNANTTYTAGTGSGNTGDTYSFGPASSAERAFGGLQSGSLIPIIGASFTNNTGVTVTSLQISYTGEQWRIGNSSTARDDRLDFQYSIDATSLTTGAWTDVDSLDFTNPIKTAASAGALDGNAAANRTAISFTITGLSIANGATFWIRWLDFNASGADDGLAIDDFSLTPMGAGSTPVLSINDVSMAEGDSGTTIFRFTVSLSVAAGPGGVTFDIATQNDTATTGGNDYVEKSLTGQTIPAGGFEYIFEVVVNGDTTVEPNETFFVNVTNITGATSGDVEGLGTITNDDFIITPIHDIQGPGASSPIVGSTVTTRGVVTGVRFNNGFFIQEPDASVDADPATSEGIFVFTSSPPPAAAAVGNLVQVTGTVTEFIPAADPLQPPVTELTSPTVTLISTGNPLPAPIPLTATFPDPAGPFDQLERIEGMRVSVASLTVIAPTQGNVNEANATATSNGVFYGVVTGVARPFREPGIQAPDPAPSGTIPPIPRFDQNPERIRVDSDGQVGASAINVGTGAVVTNLAGPLDYAFRTYTILPDPASPPAAMGGPTPTAVTAPASDEFTVASYNLERFFDTVNDPGITEPVLTATAFNNRLSKASLAIRDYLRAPDILGVVEVENLTTLQALATKINNDAVANGQPDPNYVAYLVEGNDVGGIDVGFLVKTAIVTGSTPRVTVNAVVQELDGTLFVNPDSSTDILNDRPPLRLDATVNFASGATFPVTVIVNHLRSLNDVNTVDAGSNGWPTSGARVRAKRLRQAEDLANLVQARQTANPNERIILIGDFNAFEFNDGFVDSMNVIAGTPPPDNQTVVPGDGVDLVNPDLSLLLDAPSQRYSFIFDGNAQSLDHVLVNAPLISSTQARRVEHPRINSDFPETERNDTAGVQRLADHDPVVSYYRVLQPIAISGRKFDDLNGNGVKDGNEPGLQGVTINLDKDANGSVDATAITDVNGNYSFPNLGAGVYRVRESVPAGYVQTTANPADIMAQSGMDVSGVDFGNFNCGSITVNPATLPPAFAGSQYSQTFTQTSAAPVTWSLTGSLPSGLNFDEQSATISGTPGATGVFNFTVRATFGAGCFGERAYTLAVNAIAGSIADPAVCNGPGGGVNVTATVTNFGANAQPATFKAELDATLLALPGTCVANVGTCSVANAKEVVWAGTLQAGQTVTIKYQAQIADDVTTGAEVYVVSTATIGGGAVGSVKACATVNCPEVGPGAPYPAKSEVSDQKAGSVLIYNIYTSSASDAGAQNTRISLTNVDPKRSAFVHLFFVDGQTCSVADNYVCLTPNQTTTFLTSDVDPGTTGYLVAVAIDDKGCPINFNYLIGDAYVKFASGHTANLGAEAISALAGGLPPCDENSVKAQLNFDGVSYNRLPRVLALSNIPSRADGNDTMLILNRIGGDLTSSAATLTNVFGNFYDDTENSLSFSFNPRVCQVRSSITNSFPRIAPRLDQFVPAGRSGWLKLHSVEDQAIFGAAINFNQNSGSPGAFSQGHNLHKLTLTPNASYTIPVFPPSC